jgi:hypothetical protein
MALDSRAKRESALFAGRRHTLHPSGAFAAAARQDTLGFYRGLAAPEIVCKQLCFVGRRPAILITGHRPAIQITGRA